jgi:hypothetical protein
MVTFAFKYWIVSPRTWAWCYAYHRYVAALSGRTTTRAGLILMLRRVRPGGWYGSAQIASVGHCASRTNDGGTKTARVPVFGTEHVPKTFTSYSNETVEALRREPSISNAYRERKDLPQSLLGGAA